MSRLVPGGGAIYRGPWRLGGPPFGFGTFPDLVAMHLIANGAGGTSAPVREQEPCKDQSALFAEDTSEMFELTMQQWKSRPWYNKVSERILASLRFMV